MTDCCNTGLNVLVTREAPDFTAQAVMADGSIGELTLSALRGKYVVVFFWPLDNTFVCPTEIIAFHNRLEKFKERGCDVVGVSIDSVFSHIAWRNTAVEDGGIGPVGFPMVSDLKQEICAAWGIQHANGPALRGTFLLDKDGVVRHQVVNDLPLGRNVDEALRMVDALAFFEANGEVCPAGWTQGEDAMTPNAEGVADYLATKAGSL
ncbi:MAG: peroxiredoxin [Phycisphaerales bacterium]|jgi:peroxiredoxin (alkyl hydroperoxide reductase subunit C)|nr:peroxiredoxin [Phycisphaerales bacterium]